MKQIVVIPFMLVLATSSYGGGVPNGDFKKFQIGINFSPDIAFRAFKDKSDASYGPLYINARNNNEIPKLGITAGFNACLNLNRSIGLETGLQYSNKGYQTVKMPLYPSVPDPAIPNNVRFLYNMHYIDIPLKVNFTLGNSKVRFFGSAGFVTNVFIIEKATRWSEYSDHTEKKKYKTLESDQWKSVNLSAMISAGICWQLNEKLNLRIEPTYRRGITPINDASVKIYLYNAGLNLGLYYGF